MKLKYLNRTATVAWSPAHHLPIMATGTVAGAMDASFSNTTELELFRLDLNKKGSQNQELKTAAGSVSSNARFNRLAWGFVSNDRPLGIIAGGMENGELDFWNPEAILDGKGTEECLILRNTTHTGAVRALDFNPVQLNLLASAAGNGEIYIWDLLNPSQPYAPAASRSSKLEEVTCVAWNRQVQHILATSSNTGYTVIWDLKNRREVMQLTAPGMGMGGFSGRKGVTAVAWNPDVATQVITASEDDNNPVLMMWDLRNAHAPEKILSGHTKGILSLSWCQKDADLLLSCGKDSRTLCWNPRSGEIIGELPHSNNWSFDVQWCPRNPDLLSTASFDGKINIYSIQTTHDEGENMPISAITNDPFAATYQQPSMNTSPSLSLKQPPKWLRRPVGATFGFGGKLVYFQHIVPPTPPPNPAGQPQQAAPTTYSVTVAVVPTLIELTQRTSELENAFETKNFDSLCEVRQANAQEQEDVASWKVLRVLFERDAREKLVKHLGFEKGDLVQKIGEKFKALKVAPVPTETAPVEKAEPETDKVNDGNKNDVEGLQAENQPQQDEPKPEEPKLSALEPESDQLSGLFGNKTESDDVFSGSQPDGGPMSPGIVVPSNPFSIYPKNNTEVDTLITKAIILGDFESAVAVCLESDKLSDALLLAVCGGQDLLTRTQNAYFERRGTETAYLRLLASIVKGDLADIVDNASIEEWDEILAILCTFAPAKDFSPLCERLGLRIEAEYERTRNEVSDATQYSKLRQNAVMCYLAAGKLEKVVPIWLHKQEEDDQGALEHALAPGQTKAVGSRSELQGRSLQSFIEKITVFRRAINFVDSNLTEEPASETKEKTIPPHMAMLYDKYCEYANVLASQGRLSTALRYLNLTPAHYTSNGKDAIVKDRIYRSDAKDSNLVNVLFPFAVQEIFAEGNGLPAEREYVPEAPVEQPQTTYNQFPSAASQNTTAHNTNYYEQNTPYMYNQPGYTGYPTTPAYPPSGVQQYPAQYPNMTGTNQYAPQNPTPTHQYAPQNPTPTPQNQYDTPSFYKQPTYPPTAEQTLQNTPAVQSVGPPPAKEGWNDPPMMGSRSAAGASTVRQPITSPFPNAPMAPGPSGPPSGPAFVGGGPGPYNTPPVGNSPQPVNAPPTGPAYTPRPPIQNTQYTQQYVPPPVQTPVGQQQFGGQGNPQYVGAQNFPHAAPPMGGLAPQQVPTPKPPTPVPAQPDRHPAGDRSHIPDAHKPILNVLVGEVGRLRGSPVATKPRNKKMLDDAERRLNIFFDALNNEEVSAPVIEAMMSLIQALEARDYAAAHRIHVDLLTRKSDEVGQWMVGVKWLVDLLRMQ